MKRISLLLISLCTLLSGYSQPQTWEQAGSIYYAYPMPSRNYTPVPTGYEPCYISHYGRHGSRWMTADERYSEVLDVFDSLYACKELTPLGIDVRRRLQLVWEDAQGASGNITPLGEQQMLQIARRMYTNFPQLFADDAKVEARSSTSLRCAMSMSYFTEGLKELNPKLAVSRRAYHRYMEYIAYTGPVAETFVAENASWRKEFIDFEAKLVPTERLMSSLFVKPNAIKDPVALMRSFYWIAADMQNVEVDETFYDLFTFDEVVNIWKTVNARMYVCNGAAPLNQGLMPRQAVNLLRNITEQADAALATGETTANLRFGHDTHLLRLLALLNLTDCGNAESDMKRFHLAWQDYKLTPMAGNLQIIFYRNAASKVLVKFMLNEEEVELSLAAASGPYYEWEAVRNYFISLTEK